MTTTKLTIARGGTRLKDVAIAAGTAEAQTDTLSLNIDSTRLSKGDALLMVELFRQAVFAGKWPLVAGTSPPTGATFTRSGALTANRVYQRQTITGGGQGKGQGTISPTINVTAPGAIYARTRAIDGITVSQAAWLVGTVTATGAQTLNVTGVDARLGQFYLDLGDGTTWQNGTVPVSMGALSLFAGQSLMVDMIRGGHENSSFAANGVVVDPNGWAFANASAIATPSAWAKPDDTGTTLNSAGLAEYLSRMVALTGVSCGVTGMAEGSTSIESWLPGQTRGDALLALIDAAGGAYEIEWLFQGHSNSVNGTSYSSYQSSLDALHAGWSAHNSFVNPARLVSSIPNIASNAWGTPAQIEVIRRASAEWAAANGAIAVTMSDIELQDGVHETQAGAKRIARHVYRALRSRYGLPASTRTALGRPTKSGASLVIPYTLPAAATALVTVGDPSSLFRVYPLAAEHVPGNALALAATNPLTIDQTAKTITLALAADPGAVALDIVPHGLFSPVNDGSANQIYDNAVDGDGITYGRQIAAKPMNLIVPADRTLTVGGTPAFAASKFGQGASGGYATSSIANMPSMTTGYTFELWARIVASDGAFRVMLGTTNGFYIGVIGTSLRYNSSTNGAVDIANVFVPGASAVHIARIAKPGEANETIYVNGIAVSTTPVPGRVNTNFGIRRYGSNTGYDCTADQVVSGVAILEGARWTAPFTPPTAPYAGSEEGLIAYYPLDGSFNNIAA